MDTRCSLRLAIATVLAALTSLGYTPAAYPQVEPARRKAARPTDEVTKPANSDISAAKPSSPVSLTLIAVAEPQMTEDSIVGTFKQAIAFIKREDSAKPEGSQRELPSGYTLRDDTIRAITIDQSTYDNTLNLLRTGFAAPAAPANRGVQLDKFPGQDPLLWELNLGGPFSLDKLKIDFEDGSETYQIEEVEVPPEKGSIDYLGRGVFKVRLPKGRTPKHYTVSYFKGREKAPTSMPTEDWPAPDTYWAITINDYPGSLKTLLATLSNPNKVGGEFKNMVVSEQRTFGSTSLRTDPGEPTRYVGNKVTFMFNIPKGKTPQRVLMKFPLSLEEATEELKKLPVGEPFKLSKSIGEKVRIKSDKELALTPEMPPAWFEVPSKDGTGFERTFVVDQIQGWKALPPAKQNLYRLVMYEFEVDGEDDRSAIPVVDPKNPGRSVYIFSEKVDSWPSGVQTLKDVTQSSAN